MSRDWIGVYVQLLNLPKFRKMSDAAQLSLVYAWLLGAGRPLEATWPSLAALDEFLILQGRPPGTADELLAFRWLDMDEDGTVSSHDWDDHQYAATQAGQRAWEAARKKAWRKHAPAKTPPALPVTGPEMKGHDMTASRTGPGHVRDMSRTSRDAEHERTLKRPRNGRASGTQAVPSAGECRICGAPMTDKEGSRVGPGWIEHVEHPEDRATA